MISEYIKRPAVTYFEILRDKFNKNEVLGRLFIDGKFFCYTLEPIRCIPVGTYRIEYNLVGAMNKRYFELFPSFHKGMLEICNIDGFSWVYIHIGNKVKDTLGCPLVGFGRTKTSVTDSKNAYIGLYNRLYDKKCVISIKNVK